MYPNLSEYASLAENHDLIPVCEEMLADLETPVSVLSRVANHENAFLLESIEGNERWGRYSFIGVDPELLFETEHDGTDSGRLHALRDVFSGLRVARLPGLPRFFGGAVGFVGYEAWGEFERMPAPKPGSPPAEPGSKFLKADRLIVFDNFRHTIKLVYCSRPGRHVSPREAYAEARSEIEAMKNLLEKPRVPESALTYPRPEFRPDMSKEKFSEAVERAREYIRAGDIIQVVLSRRMTADSNIPPFQLYRALRMLNPSPYTFFLKIGDRVLVGSSPEVMVRLAGNTVDLRPIAGTRPRGRTEQEDRDLAHQLLSDEKEKAEHVMLVDLGRNDIGRIAETGSVQVTDFMLVERYSHVMHIVSHVEGILKKGLDAYDVLAATFPAGTLTGAPKIRAMEIIHELESRPRGAYGGAVGYVGYDGDMDLAITIRTIEARPGIVSFQVGAGIVFDSLPEREFEETCHKAGAMEKAVVLAADGLRLSQEES
ncbi:MAG: anthranilate synthase component I family protein [Candidatus Aminicenantales bacterium]